MSTSGSASQQLLQCRDYAGICYAASYLKVWVLARYINGLSQVTSCPSLFPTPLHATLEGIIRELCSSVHMEYRIPFWLVYTKTHFPIISMLPT